MSLFSCNICNFESKDLEYIKKHLAEHTLTPKIVFTNNVKSKEECKALLKTKDWRDAYDELGDPLYDTTDSEQSSDIEECHAVNENFLVRSNFEFLQLCVRDQGKKFKY